MGKRARKRQDRIDRKIRGGWKCAGKAQRTYDQAVLAALQATDKLGELVTPYECIVCGWHHVGHPKPGDFGYGL